MILTLALVITLRSNDCSRYGSCEMYNKCNTILRTFGGTVEMIKASKSQIFIIAIPLRDLRHTHVRLDVHIRVLSLMSSR